MTLVNYTNECQSFCHISRSFTSMDEDGLEENSNYESSSFRIQRWNQHQAAVDRITRKTTFNSAEGWHYTYGLQSLFQCHNPTLRTFKDGSVSKYDRSSGIRLSTSPMSSASTCIS